MREKTMIVLALAADFDPRGAESILYKAAADNVVNTLLGGSPPQLRYAVMVPLSSVGGAHLRPVFTLREQWEQALAGHNQRMKLTGAAILVSRGMKVLQAAPAAYPYR